MAITSSLLLFSPLPRKKSPGIYFAILFLLISIHLSWLGQVLVLLCFLFSFLLLWMMEAERIHKTLITSCYIIAKDYIFCLESNFSLSKSASLLKADPCWKYAAML